MGLGTLLKTLCNIGSYLQWACPILLKLVVDMVV